MRPFKSGVSYCYYCLYQLFIQLVLLVFPLIICVKKNVKELVEISVEEHDDVKKSSDLHQWVKIFSINSSIFYFYF